MIFWWFSIKQDALLCPVMRKEVAWDRSSSSSMTSPDFFALPFISPQHKIIGTLYTLQFTPNSFQLIQRRLGDGQIYTISGENWDESCCRASFVMSCLLITLTIAHVRLLTSSLLLSQITSYRCVDNTIWTANLLTLSTAKVVKVATRFSNLISNLRRSPSTHHNTHVLGQYQSIDILSTAIFVNVVTHTVCLMILTTRNGFLPASLLLSVTPQIHQLIDYSSFYQVAYSLILSVSPSYFPTLPLILKKK